MRSSRCRAPSLRPGQVLTGLCLLASLGLPGCASPNRGEWQGTFDGTVRGVVEFTINTRGTKLRGHMEGQTQAGQPFDAKIEGTLRWERIEATFRGKSQLTGIGLPVAFTGAMVGDLGGGAGSGEWQAELIAGRMPMAGTWQVEQVEEQ